MVLRAHAGQEKVVEIPGLGQQEYYPYVSFDFNIGQYGGQ